MIRYIYLHMNYMNTESNNLNGKPGACNLLPSHAFVGLLFNVKNIYENTHNAINVNSAELFHHWHQTNKSSAPYVNYHDSLL